MLNLVYDVEKLTHVLKNFSLLTRASICILDVSFNTIACYSGKISYCNNLRNSNENLNKLCSVPNSTAIKTCCQTKSSVTYTCHAGIVETITPLFYNDILIGYIIFGGLKDTEQTYTNPKIIENVCQKYNLDYDKFKILFDNLPSFSSEQLEAYIEILNLSTSYIIEKQLLKPNETVLSAKIMSYIKSNINSNLNLKTLCDTFYISPKTLYSVVKKATGMTVNNYINSIRIENAQNMLIITNKPISEVAISVGFYDYNYFIKVFKKQTGGITPLQYRKKNTISN